MRKHDDNIESGDADDADATTEFGGGSINVHRDEQTRNAEMQRRGADLMDDSRLIRSKWIVLCQVPTRDVFLKLMNSELPICDGLLNNIANGHDSDQSVVLHDG